MLILKEGLVNLAETLFIYAKALHNDAQNSIYAVEVHAF